MKKLLLTLVLLTTNVMADPVAFMMNDSGGKIVLTNEVCTKDGRKFDNMWRLYTYNSKGATYEGCFAFEGETIHAYWPDARQARRYELAHFELYKK